MADAPTLDDYKRLIRLDIDADLSASEVNQEARQWKYWFGGYVNPLNEVRDWVIAELHDPERAEFLYTKDITPKKYAALNEVAKANGIDIRFFTSGSIARAAKLKNRGLDEKAILELLKGSMFL
jgi:hypothetical protein